MPAVRAQSLNNPNFHSAFCLVEGSIHPAGGNDKLQIGQGGKDWALKRGTSPHYANHLKGPQTLNERRLAGKVVGQTVISLCCGTADQSAIFRQPPDNRQGSQFLSGQAWLILWE